MRKSENHAKDGRKLLNYSQKAIEVSDAHLNYPGAKLSLVYTNNTQRRRNNVWLSINDRKLCLGQNRRAFNETVFLRFGFVFSGD